MTGNTQASLGLQGADLYEMVGEAHVALLEEYCERAPGDHPDVAGPLFRAGWQMMKLAGDYISQPLMDRDEKLKVVAVVSEGLNAMETALRSFRAPDAGVMGHVCALNS